MLNMTLVGVMIDSSIRIYDIYLMVLYNKNIYALQHKLSTRMQVTSKLCYLHHFRLLLHWTYTISLIFNNVPACDKYPPLFKDNNNHSDNQEDNGSNHNLVTYIPQVKLGRGQQHSNHMYFETNRFCQILNTLKYSMIYNSLTLKVVDDLERKVIGQN